MATVPKIFKRTAKLFFAWFLDWLVPIQTKKIVFVTRANVSIAGNLRVMIDAFSAIPEYKVYVFKETGEIPAPTLEALYSEGVTVLQGFSLKTLIIVLSSELVVLSHSARDAYLTHRKSGRRVINLWHGVALKKIENLMPLRGNFFQNWYRRSLIKRNSRIYDAMIASNYVDRLVNALAFNLPIQKVHPVGLPRFEYLQANYPWPADLQAQRVQLLTKLKGRKLVLYAPTFRDNGTTLSQLLPPDSLRKIKEFCEENDLVFGVRPHPYRTHELSGFCSGESLVNLSPELYPESAVLLEQAHVLIVDYSSIWVDFLYQKRPLVAYTPDSAAYINTDRGFIYDFGALFPGPTCSSWSEVLDALAQRLHSNLEPTELAKHNLAAHMLLPDAETQNGQIISDSIRVITNSQAEGKEKNDEKITNFGLFDPLNSGQINT